MELNQRTAKLNRPSKVAIEQSVRMWSVAPRLLYHKADSEIRVDFGCWARPQKICVARLLTTYAWCCVRRGWLFSSDCYQFV